MYEKQIVEGQTTRQHGESATFSERAAIAKHKTIAKALHNDLTRNEHAELKTI